MSDLEEVRSYPLSNDDINRILGGTKIYSYPELEQFPTLDDALDSKGRMVVLYLTEDRNTGHWVCVWKDGKTVKYYDPYGNAPEIPKTWNTRMKNIQLGQAPNYMTRLLKSERCPVYYNAHPYQREGDDINTCGRHVVTRLLLKDLSDSDYYELVKDSDVNPDDFTSVATYFLLGK